MQRSTRNELFIGLTISVILSLITNFALLMQRSRLVMDSEKSAPAYEIENWGLWFSLLWFFFFSFILFIICRWVYRWGSKIFRNKELKTLGLAAGVCILVACGLFRAYPMVYRAFMAQFITVHTFYHAKEHSVVLSQKVSYAIKNDSLPNKMKVGVVTVASDVNTYPLLIEHIFVLLFILLSMLLMHLFDKKQEMKLAYEKVKVEQLQNSYNALMEQINPHFFFNSLNGLNSLVRAGEQEKTLEFLEGLSKVFRYILQSKHKTLVTLDEELQFVKAYIYLLGVRYENKLFCSIQIPESCLSKCLPILSLLPLIENAAKHNVVSKRYPLQIKIFMKSENVLAISNPIQPKMEECVSNGIGLKNLQERYLMLTGMDIRISDAGGYFEVSLPLVNSSE